MKKQNRVEFAQELKVDDFPHTRSVQQNETLEHQDEETNNSDTEYTQSDETLDMAILQELIRDEEKTLDLLIKDNDRAVDYIIKGEVQNALGILEKMEKLMEYLATNGRILDRNIIIVCLYNIAATFQGSWELAKCAKYIEAVTYNLSQSINHDDAYTKSMQQKGLDEPQVLCLKAITIRKRQFLVKVYLQYCAVSSQLNRHEEALAVAQKAQTVMSDIVNECYQFCKEATKDSDSDIKAAQTPQKIGERPRGTNMSGLSVDLRKSLLNDITFRDEVYYNRQIIESALPFLEDFLKNTKEFSRGKMNEIINQTRNLLFNWKNNPENNEKYIRKELIKDKVPPKLAEENRTLLGVQQDPEWLTTLNIGSIMHMRPLKYKDYAQKREYINELTKTSLQEKSIFQSLSFFTLATEMRFMEMNKSDTNKDGSKSHGSFRASEAYHLKAIEVVCRYITGPCPYINHLITSYQKHYGQDLETIPEESVHSFTESTKSRDFGVREDRLRLDVANRKENDENDPLLKLQAITKKTNKRFTGNTTRERGKGIGDAIGMTSLMTEEERYKEMRRDRKTESFKSLNIRAKKLGNKGEEMKKVYTNSNLSLSSPTKHSKTELSIVSPKLYKTTIRYDTEALEKLDEKYSNKKNLNVPNLGLQGVLKEVTSPSLKNKVISSEGYQSERVLPEQNVKFNSHYNSSEPERRHKGAANETNFYLYKNFNKFIQNFYVKSEQATQQKAVEDKLKEKYLKHPYQKDTSDIKAKKMNSVKKPGSGTYNAPAQPKTPSQGKKSDLSPLARNHYNELFGRLENKRPKTASKRVGMGMMDEANLSHSRGNSANFKLNEKLVKSISTKDLEFLKGNTGGKK